MEDFNWISLTNAGVLLQIFWKKSSCRQKVQNRNRLCRMLLDLDRRPSFHCHTILPRLDSRVSSVTTTSTPQCQNDPAPTPSRAPPRPARAAHPSKLRLLRYRQQSFPLLAILLASAIAHQEALIRSPSRHLRPSSRRSSPLRTPSNYGQYASRPACRRRSLTVL